MFKDLRAGLPFFVFDKRGEPKFYIGAVESVSQPRLKQQANFNPQYAQEYVVDVSAKIGDSSTNFSGLPAHSIVSDGSQNGNPNVIVSTSRESIISEIESTLASSKSVINSVPRHENLIAGCEKILEEASPTFAKDKQQEENIKGLEEKITDLQTQVQTLVATLNKQANNNNKSDKS